MSRILVLGAGRSAPFLIRHLLDHAAAGGFAVTVADRTAGAAAALVDDHPHGEAVALDVGDLTALAAAVEAAGVVVNLLPPSFQMTVARACLARGRPMVSASYQDPGIRALQGEAAHRGVALLTEMGLDPGIDLMSAMELICRLHGDGGVVESFASYGSGVPAPESATNPLRYAVTWNPRNVVMAAAGGARYLAGGRLRIVPWHRIFAETWPVEVEGVGTMEAYPNRDSVSYRESLGLDGIHTLVRGTLRYPGWGEVWSRIVALGLPNEVFPIPGLAEMTWRELVETFLPPGVGEDSLEARLARQLDVDPAGRVMQALSWLGLLRDEPTGVDCNTAAQALTHLFSERLTLPPGGRDMIILHHELEVRYPRQGDRREKVISSLVEKGEPDGITAMARTVGLPAAIAARLLLSGELTVTGCPLPTEPRIYEPVLAGLAAEGLRFSERSATIEAAFEPGAAAGSGGRFAG